MVWRLSLLTGQGKGYSDDIPEYVCRRVGEKILIPEEKSTLRVSVTLETSDDDEEVDNWLFRELVGSLRWLSTSTRPDISNTVRAVRDIVVR